MKTLYRFSRSLIRLVMRIDGVRVLGTENIPSDRPVLVIANHSSYADPLIIGALMPTRLSFIAKEDFGRNPFTRKLFSALGAHFLRKSESDLSAMRIIINQLRHGGSAVIFPEGTRRFDQKMIPFKPGAAYIAQKAQVSILPIAILNSGDLLHGRKKNIIVVIGECIGAPAPGRIDAELLQQHTDALQTAVADSFLHGAEILKQEGRPMCAIPRSRRAEYPQ